MERKELQYILDEIKNGFDSVQNMPNAQYLNSLNRLLNDLVVSISNNYHNKFIQEIKSMKIIALICIVSSSISYIILFLFLIYAYIKNP